MPGWTEILIIVALLVILFGRGKISELMGDVAKGIKSFKKGMSEEANDAVKSDNMKTIDNTGQASASPNPVPNQENQNVNS
ncbi:MAG: twin-arginine translocase TatA/TatE family subunit [Pseudomonadota bacterium]